VCSNSAVSIFATIAYQITNTTPHQGYYLYDEFGQAVNFGNDGYLRYLGDASYFSLNEPIVGMAVTASGSGFWMTGSDGGVFAFGDAKFCGSTGNVRLAKPIVGMAADPATGGYWFVASDGGIFAFNAPFLGSTGAVHLTEPIVGIAPTPDGRGYFMAARDGGIFAFGDARFSGGLAGLGDDAVIGLAR
jgi:hypothetical protein